MRDFRLTGIDHQGFEPLFHLSDAELVSQGVVRKVATAEFGFPCRISLEDAGVGDELLLLPFEHLAANSPYRSVGPIFVRRGATRRALPPGEVPPYVSRRLMSVRAYDREDMMVDASVCEGIEAATEIRRMFADANVAYIHLHNARRGCFSCRAERA